MTLKIHGFFTFFLLALLYHLVFKIQLRVVEQSLSRVIKQSTTRTVVNVIILFSKPNMFYYHQIPVFCPFIQNLGSYLFLHISDDICLFFQLFVFHHTVTINQTIPLMMAFMLQVIIVQALINNVSKTFTLNNTSSVCFFFFISYICRILYTYEQRWASKLFF